MTYFEVAILAFVEGLTEYLPVSSTGHIILASAFLGIQNDPFVKDFTVIVQFGAILSVIALYWRKFIQSFDIYKKLAVGFLPAAVIGLLVKNHIDAVLGNVTVVAWALMIGGVVLIWVDRRPLHSNSNSKTGKALFLIHDPAELNYKQAFLIGLAQCLAFIPGVSRSAASILGGLWQGLDRKAAAEFSFLLAVPTLTGATAIKLIKLGPDLTSDQMNALLLGNAVSFVVGLVTIKAFILFLTQFGFSKFGWYRIGVGAVILFIIYGGYTLKM